MIFNSGSFNWISIFCCYQKGLSFYSKIFNINPFQCISIEPKFKFDSTFIILVSITSFGSRENLLALETVGMKRALNWDRVVKQPGHYKLGQNHVMYKRKDFGLMHLEEVEIRKRSCISKLKSVKTGQNVGYLDPHYWSNF